MQQPSYQLHCTPPFPIFIDSLISFDSSLFQMSGHLLGLRSFDSLEGSLFHKQASFSIILGGISLISTSTIAPITYLKNWALVVSIIVIRLMVNQRPFLLEALVQINNTSMQHAIYYRPQHRHVSIFLNNSLDNKWFIFKIPFWSICTIISSLACSLTRYLRPIVLKFYHVLALG